jgi:hypothetical protein
MRMRGGLPPGTKPQHVTVCGERGPMTRCAFAGRSVGGLASASPLSTGQVLGERPPRRCGADADLRPVGAPTVRGPTSQRRPVSAFPPHATPFNGTPSQAPSSANACLTRTGVVLHHPVLRHRADPHGAVAVDGGRHEPDVRRIIRVQRWPPITDNDAGVARCASRPTATCTTEGVTPHPNCRREGSRSHSSRCSRFAISPLSARVLGDSL